MIETIRISNLASYGPDQVELSGLSELNYLYGSNGSGKTTIGRVIASSPVHAGCEIVWKNNTELEVLTYNQDFVGKNFSELAELKGVFTLGETQVGLLEKIRDAKQKSDELKAKSITYAKTLRGEDGVSGMEGDLTTLKATFTDICWAQKVKHDSKLQDALTGYRNDKVKFRDKILSVAIDSSGESCALADLERRAQTVFGLAPTVKSKLPLCADEFLARYESEPVLSKKIIGKEDVDIAGIIQRLGNSDWVREGIQYLEAQPDICPFCQQKAPQSLVSQLENYFDETFTKDVAEVKALGEKYREETKRLLAEIEGLLVESNDSLDQEKVVSNRDALTNLFALNIELLERKSKELSQAVVLESSKDAVGVINDLISNANHAISEHNAMVQNLTTERATLISDVWTYLVETELKTDIATFNTSAEKLLRGIEALTQKKQEVDTERTALTAEIRSLEKQVTSVKPTIDAINQILGSFGFKGFKLQQSGDQPFYKIIRPDGSDAKLSLSEGEKTFVSFLYFYQLLKGSNEEAGITTDRIVVIDDPVSSLDSEILFIVGSLIKAIMKDCRDKVGHIKQVFVLTHNVYFHKEVTYNANRKADSLSEETFWIVRKPDATTKVEKYNGNPIKTSYQLLWSELKSKNKSNLTLQNTMRRILENYFRILGDMNSDVICDKFEGREKLICKSLFSWVNDGSHSAGDDLYIAIEDSLVATYLDVFRSVFEKCGHEAHYRMMMGSAFEERPTVLPLGTTSM